MQLIGPVLRQSGDDKPHRGGIEGPMAKLNHQKRHRPRPITSRRRRSTLQRVEEQRSRRDLERWRKST
jgi:hypothetical protein